MKCSVDRTLNREVFWPIPATGNSRSVSQFSQGFSLISYNVKYFLERDGIELIEQKKVFCFVLFFKVSIHCYGCHFGFCVCVFTLCLCSFPPSVFFLDSPSCYVFFPVNFTSAFPLQSIIPP